MTDSGPEPLVIREEPPLPDDAIVVRGGIMLRASVEAAAVTNYRDYGFYGVSTFAIPGLTASEIWEKSPKIAPPNYRRIRVTTAGAVRAAGFELSPTWESDHFDIVLDNPPDETTWSKLDELFSPPTNQPDEWEVER
ncbi:hypothetical protein LLS1_18280 [Leifsonia sp. LS1]|uniref:hypothetical protein n=1 Tax=Leifsonia sp. LS1 TaxID=2828483 RepID=UPI001CFEE1D5|nr:hypothetical protein [Leifsonia sp. LS1]GIT80159.1 hypothetical protein LLS1_18280 [Leifsonia sp. LS1]